MQIGFKVWQEILKGEEQSELYYSFYNFFMFGAFFIVLKVKILSNRKHLIIKYLPSPQKRVYKWFTFFLKKIWKRDQNPLLLLLRITKPAQYQLKENI